MRAGIYLALGFCLLSACSNESNLKVHNCYDAYVCTENGAIIKWPHENMKFAFEDTTPTNLRVAMNEAAKDYTDNFNEVNMQIDVDDNSAPHYRSDYASLNQDGINSIYYVKDNWPWTNKIPGALAVTLTRYSANGIIEADVFVKADATKYEIPEDEAEANNVLSWIKYISEHELGHALGRIHSKNPDSLMYPSVSMSKVINLTSALDYKDFFSAWDINIFDMVYDNTQPE